MKTTHVSEMRKHIFPEIKTYTAFQMCNSVDAINCSKNLQEEDNLSTRDKSPVTIVPYLCRFHYSSVLSEFYK